MSKKLLPFGTLPGHWGLKGKTRQRAEVEYNYAHDPEACEVELAVIDLTGPELEAEIIDISERYGSISPEDASKRRIALLADDTDEKTKASLEHARKFEGLSDNEYEKQMADINKEPWVKVLQLEIGADPKQGDFELDWNKYFIQQLETNGYVGKNDDEIIQQWFHEVCKNVALDVYDGIGDFNERADEGSKLRNNKVKKTRIGKKWEAE